MWIHQERLGEMSDELLHELRTEGELAREHLHELRKPIRYIRGSTSDLMIPVTLEPRTGKKILSTRALLDSGCTGSAINQAYVREHGLDTRKVKIPISVYNAAALAARFLLK